MQINMGKSSAIKPLLNFQKPSQRYSTPSIESINQRHQYAQKKKKTNKRDDFKKFDILTQISDGDYVLGKEEGYRQGVGGEGGK